MNAVTYDLAQGETSSHGYRKTVGEFSEEVFRFLEQKAGRFIDEYRDFMRIREPERSRAEYAVEFLTLGVVYRHYSGAASRHSRWLVGLLSYLYDARQSYPARKKAIDRLRGLITGLFVVPVVDRELPPAEPSLERMRRLVDWLYATGELTEEAKRLFHWYCMAMLGGEATAQDLLRTALEVQTWFALTATQRLGQYTEGVDRFLASPEARARFREDALLRRRSVEEYHLNMVGAEIVNWGFSPAYLRTQKRVVLLPGCMRARGDACKAQKRGADLLCVGCDSECQIAQVSARGHEDGFAVHIVLHTTSFSRSLRRFQKEGVGLVATACLLHLLVGGYQMRELGLAAQCVPLDHCGCQRHWHPEGVPTRLDVDRLVSLTRGPSVRQPMAAPRRAESHDSAAEMA